MASSEQGKNDSAKLENSSPLAAYLQYYANLDWPGFAVLVTGAWGSGKTFQVKSALLEREICYVSLFGMAHEEDVYGAVLAKTAPEAAKRKAIAKFLRDKAVSISSISSYGFGIGAPVGGVLAAALDFDAKSKVDRQKLIVFDDLERCSIKLKTMLGVINYYVEHHGCKVVVIAHDGKIIDSFKEQKEKVFGHTIAVRPETHAAVAVFLAAIDDAPRKIFEEHLYLILELFRLSGCQSLRILKLAIVGLARFCSLLEPEQVQNSTVFRRLLALHLTISIEVLRGELTRGDISDRVKAWTETKELEKQPKDMPDSADRKRRLLDSYDRYEKEIDITSFDLSNELLVAMIMDGHYEKTALQSYFAKNDMFAANEVWPAWRKFIHFDSLDDDVVKSAAKAMDDQFLKREITDIGELMHVVSLRILRIKEGLLEGSVEGAIDECLSYLDDLAERKNFPLECSGVFGPFGGHGGYTYWGREENQELFDRVRDHVIACEKKAFQDHASGIKTKLLSALVAGPVQLEKLINHARSERAEYQTLPTLLSVPPEEFVREFLELPKERWREVKNIMVKRRAMSSPTNSLAGERQWFEEFDTAMMKSSQAQCVQEQ